MVCGGGRMDPKGYVFIQLQELMAAVDAEPKVAEWNKAHNVKK